MSIVLIVIIILLLLAIRLSVVFKEKVQFYAQGLDFQFTIKELSMLWKLAHFCGIEEPTALYVSVEALNDAIAHMIELSKADGTLESPQIQDFLSKLYKYRTKIELNDMKHRGITSSRSLENGQKVNILLRGSGVFTSEVINNGRELIIAVPKKDGAVLHSGDFWIGKNLSLYLWRKGDASYVFDTRVLSAGVFLSRSVICLEHSSNLERAQKRQTIRCKCNILVNLYILKPSDFMTINYSAVESLPGYKAALEDISEAGALIKIGGRGYPDMHIKLQFELCGMVILMYGIVRSVEFDAKENLSHLHLECTHLDESMKNTILGYVYNIVPMEQKEKIDAMKMTEKDQNIDMEEIMRQEDALLQNLPGKMALDTMAGLDEMRAQKAAEKEAENNNYLDEMSKAISGEV